MELAIMENILGGEKILRKKIENPMDLIELSKEGLTKDALLHLMKYLNLSLHQMAEILPITERTIQRYKRSRHFNRVVSEQMLKIAEVAAKGLEVFDNQDKFLNWINQPNKVFSNQKPLSLLGTFFGTEMILDELVRIEHGVFS